MNLQIKMKTFVDNRHLYKFLFLLFSFFIEKRIPKLLIWRQTFAYSFTF